MATVLSTRPSVIESPPKTSRPKVPCAVFLKCHHDSGGLDSHTFSMLYRMIEMIGAIDWEVHLVYQSKIPSATSAANVQWYLNCMLQGCNTLCNTIQRASTKAKEATASLPALQGTGADEMETRVRQWRWKIKTLHKPNNNDCNLWRAIARHCNDKAYQPLLQLHICKPHYGLECLVKSAAELQAAYRAVYLLIKQANRHVSTLHDVYQKTAGVAVDALQDVPDLLSDNAYKGATDSIQKQLPIASSKSFSIAEEVARRRHYRAATFCEAGYTTATDGVALVQTRTEDGLTIGMRRKGYNIPRIFTGSFSELEASIRSLRLDKVDTPIAPSAKPDQGHVKIRDFGATPAISPSGTPSCEAFLQRREAVVSRDTELQERIIRGEIISSRRPSTKEKAHTIDNSADLEAWLSETRSGAGAPRASQRTVRRGDLRHRENTL